MSILIIGMGNPLRGDDEAGPAAARRLHAWGAARGVDSRLLIVHQLGPEIAEELAAPGVRTVVFVDASVDALVGGSVEFRRNNSTTWSGPEGLLLHCLCGEGEGGSGSSLVHTGLTHYVSPWAVKTYAAMLYDAHPVCWALAIPASAFDIGAEFSLTTEAALARIDAESPSIFAVLQGKGREQPYSDPRPATR